MDKVDEEVADNIVQDHIESKTAITEGSFPDRFSYYLYCRQKGL